MKNHPITGLPIEDGSGALSEEFQVEHIHLPYIRQWQGEAAEAAMRARLAAAEAPPIVPEPEPAPVPGPMPPAHEEAAHAELAG